MIEDEARERLDALLEPYQNNAERKPPPPQPPPTVPDKD